MNVWEPQISYFQPINAFAWMVFSFFFYRERVAELLELLIEKNRGETMQYNSNAIDTHAYNLHSIVGH